LPRLHSLRGREWAPLSCPPTDGPAPSRRRTGRAAGSGLGVTPTGHDHHARWTRPGKHVVNVAGLPAQLTLQRRFDRGLGPRSSVVPHHPGHRTAFPATRRRKRDRAVTNGPCSCAFWRSGGSRPSARHPPSRPARRSRRTPGSRTRTGSSRSTTASALVELQRRHRVQRPLPVDVEQAQLLVAQRPHHELPVRAEPPPRARWHTTTFTSTRFCPNHARTTVSIRNDVYAYADGSAVGNTTFVKSGACKSSLFAFRRLTRG